jgi:hypothetical protein
MTSLFKILLVASLFTLLPFEIARASKPLDSISEKPQIIERDQVSAKEQDEFFKNQAPLSESEMPYAVELLKISQNDQSFNDATLIKFAEGKGVSPERMNFIMTKVTAGMLIDANPELKDLVIDVEKTERALPSPAEMEIIKKYIPELTKSVE